LAFIYHHRLHRFTQIYHRYLPANLIFIEKGKRGKGEEGTINKKIIADRVYSMKFPDKRV
jgi:hypothetical protein